MGRAGIVIVVSWLVANQGCRDTTILGTERSINAPSSDSDVDRNTDTNADTMTDTDLGTDIPIDAGMDSEVSTDTGMDSDTGTDTGEACGVPTEFRWTSTGPLINPPSGKTSIKDPSVVYYDRQDGQDGQWVIYATAVSEPDPLTMTYLSFTDWAQAGAAVQTPVDSNANLGGYKAAPQLFYFSPDNLWYLIYQTQDPAYSVNTDPTNVEGWSAPVQFMPLPPILTDNDKLGFDYWVICDETDCYMFFSALDGVLYRAKTAKADFPDGFEGTTEEVMREDDVLALYDASNVYKMAGTDRYLLLVSAIGNGKRYSRFWTADRLDGGWDLPANMDANTFASPANVTGSEWSDFGISHGEMLRENPDETMTIDTCNMQYLFSGLGETGYSLALLRDAR